MAILNKEIIQFAAGNTDFYEAAVDNYFNPTPEKSNLVDTAFFAEVERLSHYSRGDVAPEMWAKNPMNSYAALSIVDAVITAILPNIMSDAFKLFMDIRTVGPGDIMKFRVQPNTLYTVSKGGRNQRADFRQKKFAGDVIVVPQEHIVTIDAGTMYRVLANLESPSEFIRLVVMSVEQDMYAEAVDALVTGLTAATAGTPYTYTGNFDMAQLVKMAERVQVYNQGVRPVIAGTAVALMNVIPDSTSGYRMVTEAAGGSIDFVRGVFGFDVLRLNQAASKDGNLILPDDRLFIISPAQDKLVKGAVSGSLTNSNQFYDAADLVQNFTYRKNYAFSYASAAKAAQYIIA